MPGTVISDDNWEEFEPKDAFCSETELVVRLANGMSLTIPLWWYPSLLAASPEDRNRIDFSPSGLHWPHLDEDLSIEAMLSGQKAPGAVAPAQAAE